MWFKSLRRPSKSNSRTPNGADDPLGLKNLSSASSSISEGITEKGEDWRWFSGSTKPVNDQSRRSETQRIIASQFKESGVSISADTTSAILEGSSHSLFGLPFLIELGPTASGLYNLIIRALENQTCHPESTSGWNASGSFAIV
jgi:hypothetical protein